MRPQSRTTPWLQSCERLEVEAPKNLPKRKPVTKFLIHRNCEIIYVSETLHVNPLSYEIICYIATCPQWSEKECLTYSSQGPMLLEAPSQPPLPWSPQQRRNCTPTLKTPTPKASHTTSMCVSLANEVTQSHLTSKESGRKINTIVVNSPYASHNKICLKEFLRVPLKCCIRMLVATHKRKRHGNLNNKSLNNQGNFWLILYGKISWGRIIAGKIHSHSKMQRIDFFAFLPHILRY